MTNEVIAEDADGFRHTSRSHDDALLRYYHDAEFHQRVDHIRAKLNVDGEQIARVLHADDELRVKLLERWREPENAWLKLLRDSPRIRQDVVDEWSNLSDPGVL